jgi:S-phase kinase-associated protein 1
MALTRAHLVAEADDPCTMDESHAHSVDAALGPADDGSSEAGDMVTLKSSDGKAFEVEERVACMSATISALLADFGSTDAPIPLPNVSAKVLETVIAFCKQHVNDDDDVPKPATTDDDAPTPAPSTTGAKAHAISGWDKTFVETKRQDELFALILAANYLDIEPLLNLTCHCVADMIVGKTAEGIRQTFNIKNDFTPDEEEVVRKEQEWCEV